MTGKKMKKSGKGTGKMAGKSKKKGTKKKLLAKGKVKREKKKVAGSKPLKKQVRKKVKKRKAKKVVRKVAKKAVKKSVKKKNLRPARKATKKTVKKVKKKAVRVPEEETLKREKVAKKNPTEGVSVGKKAKGKEEMVKKAKAKESSLQRKVVKKESSRASEKKSDISREVYSVKPPDPVQSDTVEKEKFYSHPEPHREEQGKRDPFATPIDPPGVYLKDRIVLLVIDPKFVHVYWEVKPETMEAGKNSIGHDCGLTLRIYDTTCIDSFNGNNAHHFWDVPVHDACGGWYLRLGHADKTLIVDIGLKNGRGDYYTLVRSNFAGVPRDSIAPTDKIYWMTVNEQGQAVITEVEDFTEDDLELLRRMLGEEMYRRLLKGNLSDHLGASEMRERFFDVSPAPGGASDLSPSTGASGKTEDLMDVSVLRDPGGK